MEQQAKLKYFLLNSHVKSNILKRNKPSYCRNQTYKQNYMFNLELSKH